MIDGADFEETVAIATQRFTELLQAGDRDGPAGMARVVEAMPERDVRLTLLALAGYELTDANEKAAAARLAGTAAMN